MSKDVQTFISDVYYAGNGIIVSYPELDYTDRIRIIEYARDGYHLEQIINYIGKNVWDLATGVTEDADNQIGFRLTLSIEPIEKELT